MNKSAVLLDEIIISDESGFACSKTKLVENGLVHLRPFNVTNDGHLSFEQLYRVPPGEAPNGKGILEKGDILFNNTNSTELVGKAALISQRMEAGFSNHLTRIRVDETRVLPQFMVYWLRRTRDSGYFSAHATQWVSQAAFKSSELRHLEMPIPPLDEQRRIVDILSRAEGIVRLRREAEKKAAEIIRALFLDMFGDPATNPRGWPAKKVGDVVSSIDSGHSPKCNDRQKNEHEWGVLRLSAVTMCEYLESEHKTLPDEIDYDPTIEVQQGDLLLSRKNTYDLVGACAYVWKTRGKMLLPDLIFRLQIYDKQVLNPIYLWSLLTTEAKRASLKKLANGSAGSMPNISKQRLRTLNIELPPIEMQLSFAKTVEQIQSVRVQQKAAIQKAEAAFDALLARAFNSDGSNGGRP